VLITRDFVFVHVPKTGGTFIRTVCEETLPPGEILHREIGAQGSHAPYADLPAEYAGLPAFALVRNPWDWYVSWFTYLVERRGAVAKNDARRALWSSAFQDGAADFAQVVRRACTGELDHELAPRIRERGIDFYSAWWNELAEPGASANRLEVLRFERLRDDVINFVDEKGIDASDEFREGLRSHPTIRASSRGHYRDYYDPDLRDLVGASAKALIDRFGYAF
jgi:hypothetical protein